MGNLTAGYELEFVHLINEAETLRSLYRHGELFTFLKGYESFLPHTVLATVYHEVKNRTTEPGFEFFLAIALCLYEIRLGTIDYQPQLSDYQTIFEGYCSLALCMLTLGQLTQRTSAVS